MYSSMRMRESPCTNSRTVPSGGARHSFETYLLVDRIADLARGLYRYLPLEHKLYFLSSLDNFAEKVSEGCREQKFVGNAAVVFAWTTIPYRAEWRYDVIAHKMIAIDAGHLCQNLYLASESIGAGTCAIGAYDQARRSSRLTALEYTTMRRRRSDRFKVHRHHKTWTSAYTASDYYRVMRRKR